jgi:hypothetical protein
MVNVIDEGKGGTRQGMHSALHGRPLRGALQAVLTTGQSVDSSVQVTRLILHVKDKAEAK